MSTEQHTDNIQACDTATHAKETKNNLSNPLGIGIPSAHTRRALNETPTDEYGTSRSNPNMKVSYQIGSFVVVRHGGTEGHPNASFWVAKVLVVKKSKEKE